VSMVSTAAIFWFFAVGSWVGSSFSLGLLGGVPGQGFLLPPRPSRGLLVAPFLVLFGTRNI